MDVRTGYGRGNRASGEEVELEGLIIGTASEYGAIFGRVKKGAVTAKKELGSLHRS